MKIFLDDERNPPSSDWVVVKNIYEFIRLIKKTDINNIEEISFDHDLGLDPNSGGILPSGYEAAKWFVDYLISNDLTPKNLKTITVHSANPAGAENIRGFFFSAQKAGIIPKSVSIK